MSQFFEFQRVMFSLPIVQAYRQLKAVAIGDPKMGVRSILQSSW